MTAVDPLDVLERIHRDVKLLADLAGPAIKVTIEAVAPERQESDAPPAEPSRGRVAVGAELPHVRRALEFAERVATYLAAHPGARQAKIAADLGAKPLRVVEALRRLGDRVERGPGRRAPGQTSGRPSPTWTLRDPGSADTHALTVTSAIKPRIVECIRNLDTPTFSRIVRELYPGAKVSRRHQPAKAVAILLDAMEAAGEVRPDGTYRGGTVYQLVESDPLALDSLEPEPELPEDLGTLGPQPTPPLSPRTRKSMEREQAEAQAIAALGEPPESRVFELLRERNLTIREIAAELGEHQAVVAEEVHGLKPWLIQLHDGRLRAIERLREAA